MIAETKKFSLAEVESLELAPAALTDTFQGWVPNVADEKELRDALEKALDYRGDVTLTLKNAERIEAFIFNRETGSTLQNSRLDYFTATAPEKRSVSYADIDRLEFTGKDCAAGKHWEAWVKKYQERKAAGEKGIALAPEVLD